LAALRSHASYRAIQAEFGFASVASVQRAVARARAAEHHRTREERRADQSAAIDRAAFRYVRMMATDANPDRAIRAGERLIALWERQAKLWGLDDPTRRQIEVQVINIDALRAYRSQIDHELEELGFNPAELPPGPT